MPEANARGQDCRILISTLTSWSGRQNPGERRSGRDPGSRPYARTRPNPRKHGRKHLPTVSLPNICGRRLDRADGWSRTDHHDPDGADLPRRRDHRVHRRDQRLWPRSIIQPPLAIQPPLTEADRAGMALQRCKISGGTSGIWKCRSMTWPADSTASSRTPRTPDGIAPPARSQAADGCDQPHWNAS
jgi:hypothetical protein